MHITIFANGTLEAKPINLTANSYIIAADGGARHCIRAGIIPNMIIGDFDSLSEGEKAIFQSGQTEFKVYPADKDETDLELALNLALEKGATEVDLYGLLGGRWDMSFANILLLAAPRFAAIRFQVIAENTKILLARANQPLSIRGEIGETLSLIPLSPIITGLTYSGLAWPLADASLEFSSPRAVSNQFAAQQAHIQFKTGLALVVVSRQ